MRQANRIGRPRLRGGAAAALAGLLLVLTGSEATGETGGGAEASSSAASTPLTHSFAPARASTRAWSGKRMAAAVTPMPLPGQGAQPAASAAARTPLRSKTIKNPDRYPNRAHGRTFFSSGGRDYSCSATVVTTGAGNTILTAAHCVFDRETGEFVDELIFAPGYRKGKAPFGAWKASHAAVPGGWPVTGSADLDTGLLQLEPRDGSEVQELVGSRGIGFKQKPKGRLHAYGYPAAPARYNGEQLVRCGSRAKADPFHSGSIAIRCDMKQGASGGGWVAQKSFLVANTSHGHGGSKVIFGPLFGRAVKTLYGFNDKGSFPSVKPVRCGGRIATIVGTDAGEKIKGTKKKDVIATLGGDDKVITKGGRDRVCAGEGDDFIKAGGGRDRIDAGRGTDRCDGGGGRDRAKGCERERRVP